jgi:hypothetical protein
VVACAEKEGEYRPEASGENRATETAAPAASEDGKKQKYTLLSLDEPGPFRLPDYPEGVRYPIAIHSRPETQSRVVGRLEVNDEMEITGKAEDSREKIGDIWSHWYKIRFHGRDGYIWGGHLAEKTFICDLDGNGVDDYLYYRFSDVDFDFGLFLDTWEDLYIFMNNQRIRTDDKFLENDEIGTHRHYHNCFFELYHDGTVVITMMLSVPPGHYYTFHFKDADIAYMGTAEYEYREEAERRYVNAPEGLRVRERPDLASKKLYLLEHETGVKILETDTRRVVIDGITGNWVHIQQGGIRGWVFGGYLVPEPDGARAAVGKITGVWIITEMDGKTFDPEDELYYCFYDDGTYSFGRGNSTFQWRSGHFSYSGGKFRLWGSAFVPEADPYTWDYSEQIEYLDDDHFVFTYKDGTVTRAFRKRYVYDEEIFRGY